MCLCLKTHLFLFLCSRFQKLYQMQPGHSRKLRPDVSGSTSRHNDYYVGTYQTLRRDVISSMSSVKLQEKRLKNPSIEPKKRIFAQCFLSFHPKIPLKHLSFAGFYGNIWQIKPKSKELPYP